MQYDILIKNATIFDGTNTRPYKSNVVVKDGKIVKIGENVDEQLCSTVFNADKRYLCPGFIDINNLSDHYLTLLSSSTCENLIKQGVTSIITGHCGSSLAPLIKNQMLSFKPWVDTQGFNTNWRSFKKFLNVLESKDLGVNVGSLVGWNVIRSGLVGESFKNLSDFELKQLLILVKQSMKEGALGVSFGFGYPTGRAISKREILAVYEEVKRFNPLFSFNLRNEDSSFLLSIQEVLSIVNATNINTLITEFKVQNKENFDLFNDALKLINNYNTRSENKIHFSIYPYNYTCQSLYNLMPDWLLIGGDKAVKKNLSDKLIIKKLLKELKQNRELYKKLILLDIDKKYMVLKGLEFEAIAKNMNLSVEEAVIKLLSMTQKKIIVLNKNLLASNVDKGIKNSYGIVASNGVCLNNNAICDQRSTNSMIKFLSSYKDILPFENLVYKISGLVKEKVGLKNKGYIKIGMDADLVLINPNNLADLSSVNNPNVEPKGIETVIINGKISYDKGVISKDFNGKIIKSNN